MQPEAPICTCTASRGRGAQRYACLRWKGCAAALNRLYVPPQPYVLLWGHATTDMISSIHCTTESHVQ